MKIPVLFYWVIINVGLYFVEACFYFVKFKYNTRENSKKYNILEGILSLVQIPFGIYGLFIIGNKNT